MPDKSFSDAIKSYITFTKVMGKRRFISSSKSYDVYSIYTKKVDTPIETAVTFIELML